MSSLTPEQIEIYKKKLEAFSEELSILSSPHESNTEISTEIKKTQSLINEINTMLGVNATKAVLSTNAVETQAEVETEEAKNAKNEIDKKISEIEQLLETLKKKKKESEAAFTARGQGADFILEAFRKQYPKANIEKKNGHDLLTFPSADEAKNFFIDQAKNPECPPFLAQRYDGDTEVNDYHFYCGVGEVFSGSKETVEAALKSAIDAETEQSKKDRLTAGLEVFKRTTSRNAATEFRDILNERKVQNEVNENNSGLSQVVKK